MQARNIIDLDFSSSPDLAEIFAGKSAGDPCEITIKLKIKEITDKGVLGVIERVTSEYDEDKKASPTPEEPMAIALGPTKKLYPSHGEEE